MKKIFFLLSSLFLYSSLSFAQTITIKGKVLDATSGKAVPGTVVIAKGTTSSTTTRTDGSFTLTAENQNPLKVVFESVGFKSTERVYTSSNDNIVVRLSY